MAISLFQIEEILARVSNGETLTAVCEDDHLPTRGAFVWACRNDETLTQRFALAIEFQVDAWSDEIIEISDNWQAIPDPQSRKLSVETRKWVMAKRLPNKYSERHINDHNHNGGIELHVHGTFPQAPPPKTEGDAPE